MSADEKAHQFDRALIHLYVFADFYLLLFPECRKAWTLDPTRDRFINLARKWVSLYEPTSSKDAVR